ncbi:MAG: hypothetical protein PHW76_07655 [Alphaproteobacteria bacterium]|nr:hypothetical protein [Alphaproteobacteria bacterium]
MAKWHIEAAYTEEKNLRVLGDAIPKLTAARAFANPNNWEQTVDGMKFTLPKETTDEKLEFLKGLAKTMGIEFKPQATVIGEKAVAVTKNALSAAGKIKKSSFSLGGLKNAAKAVTDACHTANSSENREKAGNLVGTAIAGKHVFLVPEKSQQKLFSLLPWLEFVQPEKPAPRTSEPFSGLNRN